MSYELNGRNQYAHVGDARLARGSHAVKLSERSDGLVPGSTGDRLLGPLVLDPATPRWRVGYEPPYRWRSLCGLTLDWVETVSGAGRPPSR